MEVCCLLIVGDGLVVVLQLSLIHLSHIGVVSGCQAEPPLWVGGWVDRGGSWVDKGVGGWLGGSTEVTRILSKQKY